MAYILLGFVFGLFIPYIARRFAKFMPASFGYAIWQIIKFPKMSCRVIKSDYYKSFLWRSFMAGLICAVLSCLFLYHFRAEGIVWKIVFLFILLLLAEIDWRMFLLPDILTVPLLILGFFASSFDYGYTIGADSALGAMFGYFLPSIASLLLVWRKRDAFGGGDIKLLAALGAWLGVMGVLYTIVLASFGQLIVALFRKQKAIAFGPALALAGIVVAIYFF